MHTVNCVQVQSTNDASTISKYSTANKHYIKDDFLQCFVNKNHSRASLIHLGYYARMIIFHKVVVNFIEQMRHRNLEKFQIISCGSGFDTTYWRLSESNLLRKEDLFVEIDFLPVIEKKIKIIDQSEKLKAYLNYSSENNNQKSAATQLNSNYFLLAADLSNTDIIEGLLNNIKIDYNCPTLFLSECVITYMKLEDSDNLIKWMSKKFSNCSFINYEQIHPHDGFGTVLMRHFNKLQSPLFSVTRYPDCDSHIKRYKNLSFENVLAFSEWEVLRSLTTNSEHENAITLEQFDEFEEFHLKCVHYVVAVSSKGSLNNCADCLNLEMKKFRTDFREILSWKRIPTSLELYGHVSCKIGNKIILFGGVTRRQRSSRIYEVTETSHSHFSNFNSKEIDLDMVHGSCCHFIMKDKNYVCLFGGRKSPNKICNEEKAVVLEYDGAGFILKETVPLPSMMVPRYRSSLVCQYEDSEKISLWIFGGRATDLKIGLPDIWRLEMKLNETGNFSYEWTHLKEDAKSKPCSRISPSAVACNTNSLMYLSGGLTSHSFIVLNDIWKFCFINKTWCQIHLKSGTLLPRYGHTSHIINDILYLVGGTNTFAEAQPGLAVINLKSLSVIEYAIPTNDIHPFLFFNHSSQLIQDEDSDDAILVVGGGGNCFSFGTYLNDSMQVIKLKQFFLKEK